MSVNIYVVVVVILVHFLFCRFGDSGCSSICRGLYGNRTLLRLSLCYCDLGPPSGEILGKTVSNTALR